MLGTTEDYDAYHRKHSLLSYLVHGLVYVAGCHAKDSEGHYLDGVKHPYFCDWQDALYDMLQEVLEGKDWKWPCHS